jgi:hypothetical protein
MSDTLSAADRAELHTQLFANLVMQHASMALIYLGASPHPETGKTVFDLEGAQHFIDTLEMLEVRSKGNLSADEAAVLKQALATARMAFVQAVEHGAPKETPAEPKAVSPAPAEPTPDAAAIPSSPDEEERKKFVKKY